MKTLLLYPDHDFEWERNLPSEVEDLVQDLALRPLFSAMAGGDELLLKVCRRGILCSLTDRDSIVYRQRALVDCVEHEDTVRRIYNLTVETLVEQKKIHGWFSQTPAYNLRYAAEVMELLVRMLRRLRETALDNGQVFSSPAFKRFFKMLVDELDEPYFAEVNDHLQRLQFKRGALITASLGKGNSAIDIVLRRPFNDKPHWSELILGPRESRLYFDVHPRDEGGHHALAEWNARGVDLVANALTQATQHVLGFFVQLRAELAFYISCLNLKQAIEGRGYPVGLPDPLPGPEPALAAKQLYDASLALTVEGQVTPNEISADGKELVVITGANQGGKSTFLRSVGIAQLLMQAGMFVPAAEFSANVASALFTHFKREEDETMTRGKLDEELSRMSRIVDEIQPGAVLLCNESFASTNEREGSEIGEQVIGTLTAAGVKVLLVTHLFELSQRFRRDEADGVLFLRAERLADGTRTFRIREGEPLPTSHGKDVYEKILGSGP